MAQFKYEGRDRSGRKKAGMITAVSRREAAIKLREKGIRPMVLTEVPPSIWNKEISFGRAVKPQHFVIFFAPVCDARARRGDDC